MIYRAQRGDRSSREKHWDSFTPNCKAPGVPVQLGSSSSTLLLAARGRCFALSRQNGYKKSSDKLSQNKTCAGGCRGQFSNLWSCPHPPTARMLVGSPPPMLRCGKGGLWLSINRSSDSWLANAALPASGGLNASRFLISGLVLISAERLGLVPPPFGGTGKLEAVKSVKGAAEQSPSPQAEAVSPPRGCCPTRVPYPPATPRQRLSGNHQQNEFASAQQPPPVQPETQTPALKLLGWQIPKMAPKGEDNWLTVQLPASVTAASS